MPARTSWAQATKHFALVAAAVLGITTAGTSTAAAKPSPPPNPTNSQLVKAKAAKDELATRVGQAGARIALIQNRIQGLDSAAQLAEQKLALALQRRQRATDAATVARSKVDRARMAVDRAHRAFVAYVQASYMNGDAGGDLGSLLTAADPNALLNQAELLGYQSSHQIDAIGVLERATVTKSNSDALARGALAKQAETARQAHVAQQDVLAALAAAKSQKSTLNDQLLAERAGLRAAQIKLTGLRNQRDAYRAWKREQARLAALEAQRLRERRLAQQRAAAANAARAPAPAGGNWTAAKGRRAVHRAMGYLRTPYSWAAGNASGRTYGVSEPGSAWNDSNILGFDCSGLTIYAWAPWLSMDHYAASQYTEAGRYHPSINNLRPGDLMFWSGDGTIAGIGHEAMYIGNGNVIQAPQSGDVIKITNVYNVESGYIGATRPLT